MTEDDGRPLAVQHRRTYILCPGGSQDGGPAFVQFCFFRVQGLGFRAAQETRLVPALSRTSIIKPTGQVPSASLANETLNRETLNHKPYLFCVSGYAFMHTPV